MHCIVCIAFHYLVRQTEKSVGESSILCACSAFRAVAARWFPVSTWNTPTAPESYIMKGVSNGKFDQKASHYSISLSPTLPTLFNYAKGSECVEKVFILL